jgi:hypothetical protein
MRQIERETKMKTQLKKITYQQFCEKFRAEYGTSLRPDKARQIAAEHGYKIADLHNIADDAKADNRL